MTRHACLGREGTLRPHTGTICHPLWWPSGDGAVWAPQLEAGGRSPETWSLSPGPGQGEEGCRSTWSLAAFLGQGRERKYMNRAAPGLAIWAEMPAAGWGCGRRGQGWSLKTGSQLQWDRSPELRGQLAWGGGPGHLWAECFRHSGSGDPGH